MNFELPQAEDISELLSKACSSYHCSLDGEVVEDQYLKIACLRMEEGMTISLTQTIMEHEIEREYEEFIQKEGASMY